MCRYATAPRPFFATSVSSFHEVSRGLCSHGLTKPVVMLRGGVTEKLCLQAVSRSGESLPDSAVLLRDLRNSEWVVYSKPPFDSPAHVLAYLARYTHRGAISNHRLVSIDDGRVRFHWRDYRHHNKRKCMTLDASEFTGRFLLHALPPQPAPEPSSGTGAEYRLEQPPARWVREVVSAGPRKRRMSIRSGSRLRDLLDVVR